MEEIVRFPDKNATFFLWLAAFTGWQWPLRLQAQAEFLKAPGRSMCVLLGSSRQVKNAAKLTGFRSVLIPWKRLVPPRTRYLEDFEGLEIYGGITSEGSYETSDRNEGEGVAFLEIANEGGKINVRFGEVHPEHQDTRQFLPFASKILSGKPA